jgi:hypothetical protein
MPKYFEIIGREDAETTVGPVGHLGTYRARDGSMGAPVGFDFDRPHATLIVGKRGYGKSYTLGVLIEEAAQANGITPVVIDPMGVFDTVINDLDDDPRPAHIYNTPKIRTDAVPPAHWPALLGADPDSPPGALIWDAAATMETLAAMIDYTADSMVADHVRRGALNRLQRAVTWEVFDPAGIDAETLSENAVTIFDCRNLADAAMNALVIGVGEELYAGRLSERIDTLPWLFIDEAHVCFNGIAVDTLQTLLTRGRTPGVSVVIATQRPTALPAVVASQSDIRIIHRLTAGSDVRALAASDPVYLDSDLASIMPNRPGDVVIIDDTAETVHHLRIRNRETQHGGTSPRVSDETLSS